MNFLRNPNFEENAKNAINLFEDILSRYPKHLIGILCLSYAFKLAGEIQHAEDTVNRAYDLINNEPDIYDTYKKHIDPGNLIFDDFWKSRYELRSQLPHTLSACDFVP